MTVAVSPSIDRRSSPPADVLVSPHGRAVLGALRVAADGQLSITEVLQRVRRADTRAAVARASLSRTLRRLWRAGLVELLDAAGCTLTGATQQRQRFAAIARDQPEACYRAYLARCHRLGEAVVFYATAAGFVAAWRDVARQRPYLYGCSRCS